MTDKDLQAKLQTKYIHLASGPIRDKETLRLIEYCKNIFKKCGYAIENDIDYCWYRSSDSYGCMCLPKEEGGNFTLMLNSVCKNDPDELANTICHELCHYIVLKIRLEQNILIWKSYSPTEPKKLVRRLRRSSNYGYWSSHGGKWHSVAAKISKVLGSSIERTGSPEGKPWESRMFDDGNYRYKQNPSKHYYIVKCLNCGWERRYASRPRGSFVADPNHHLDKDGMLTRCPNCGTVRGFETTEYIDGKKVDSWQ